MEGQKFKKMSNVNSDYSGLVVLSIQYLELAKGIIWNKLAFLDGVFFGLNFRCFRCVPDLLVRDSRFMVALLVYALTSDTITLKKKFLQMNEDTKFVHHVDVGRKISSSISTICPAFSRSLNLSFGKLWDLFFLQDWNVGYIDFLRIVSVHLCQILTIFNMVTYKPPISFLYFYFLKKRYLHSG